jgi:hypothetical protein
MSRETEAALDDAELQGQEPELLADRSAMSTLTMPGETPGIVPETGGDGTVFDGSCFPEYPPEQADETS